MKPRATKWSGCLIAKLGIFFYANILYSDNNATKYKQMCKKIFQIMFERSIYTTFF